jgi:hypothetical protein
MDSIFPNSAIAYRAITHPSLHHAAYAVIIAAKAATAALCWIGAFRLLRRIRSDAGNFNRAKTFAVAGLMSIGGEWFGMWMSGQWNGVPSAFRILVTIIAVLIFWRCRTKISIGAGPPESSAASGGACLRFGIERESMNLSKELPGLHAVCALVRAAFSDGPQRGQPEPSKARCAFRRRQCRAPAASRAVAGVAFAFEPNACIGHHPLNFRLSRKDGFLCRRQGPSLPTH